jgi:prepilin signal peptidase PulO-like enzyme (type II secretory pathway)
MPDHKSHRLFGMGLWVLLLIFLILTYPQDPQTIGRIALVGFLFCYLGSILPDIDEKHSSIFKHVRFFIFVIVFVVSYATVSAQYPKTTLAEMLYLLAICLLVAIAAVLFFYAVIPAHRKGIHSMLAGSVYAVFALGSSYVLLSDLWLSIVIAVFGFLAYFSHLLLDRSIK